MKSIFLLIILLLSIFGSNDVPVVNTKVYLENANTNELVGFTKIGQNGLFHFTNLDPGVYYLSVEIPESEVRELDRRSRSRFDTDIVAGYNKSKKTVGWQRKDGFVHISIQRTTKIADLFNPLFETTEIRDKQCDEEELAKRKTTFFERLKQSNTEKDMIGKITIMQLTVANSFGTITGKISSVSQRDFHRMMVGTGKVSLEDQGAVQVLVRDK